MNLVKTLTKYSPKSLRLLFTSTPTQYLISYILQSLLFTLSLTSFMTAILKSLSLPYLRPLVTNSLTKSLLTLFFLYLEVWGYEGWLRIAGWACGIFVGLYVYDCGMGLAESYVGRVRGRYLLQVLGWVLAGVVMPLVVIQIYVKEYPTVMYIILVVELATVGITNALKNRHIIFTSVSSLSILSIPLLRHLRFQSTWATNLPL